MRFTASALLLALVLAACGDPAAREEWLHGTWTLAHNPQGDSNDVLRFARDGTVAIHTENDQVIHGNYSVTADDLALTLDVDARNVDVHFEISDDRSRLVYSTGAYYTRETH